MGSAATKKTTKLQNNNKNNNNITHSGSKPIMLLISFIQPLQKVKNEKVYTHRMRKYRILDVINALEIISTGKLSTGYRNKY
jgi:hypothetical protein